MSIELENHKTMLEKLCTVQKILLAVIIAVTIGDKEKALQAINLASEHLGEAVHELENAE